MPQSLSKVWVHLIFSTKHREPLIGPEIRPRLHAYMVGILDNLKSPSLQTGGVADHVHILCLLSRTISQAELVEEVKKSSSKWMKAEGGVPGFSWQAGYWIRRVFHRRIAGRHRHQIHPEPGRASPHGYVSGRVPKVFGAIQGGV